ncbi:RiPP maturation radical SAM C-methyltransferase [Plantactinospora sp. WMMB334]|uniref:RiPP maturation radical SAM C-methyltransferase n=1 Tax=Plantactinospora sp. WMMB334 TaxID=3404119 RepID=UPI003B95085D
MRASLPMAGPLYVSRPDSATRGRQPAWPVILVSMPFMGVYRPSIQLGLLKALAEEYGFPVRTLHANLDFAARLGVDYYGALSEHRGRLVGEWLFSAAAFGDDAPDREGKLLDEFAAELSYLGDSPGRVRDRLLRTREQDVPAYLEALVDTVPWDEARVVGFSSTFQQNVASFALARRLKERWPQLITVFGGANFDGEMGLEWVRSIDCVDYAVIGEGDVAFPGLLSALAAGTDPSAVPGVARRTGGTVVSTAAAPPLPTLDDLPAPDYAEYFTRAERLALLPKAGKRQLWIPFESARGCWWGAKHHCTFCGLNGTTMEFRAKSPARVLDELGQQVRRYGSFRFEAVDNIVSPAYLKRLFPALIEMEAGYEFFYEVKANLTREQLKLMALAGLRRIQPGLESLSSEVLRLMRKGVTAAQNVNLLRWCRYYDIDVGWNIIWGFPGETAEQYAEQAAIVPHLRHLQPPRGAGRLWLERFSPLYADEATFPLRSRAPEQSYRYVYPDDVNLGRAAYFFEYDPVDPLPDAAYEDLGREVRAWQAAWSDDHRPSLTYRSTPGFLQIYDVREPGREGTYTFHGTVADIYLACGDRPTTASAVREKVHGKPPLELIHEVFDEFRRRGLMLVDGSLALALALPAIAGR